MDESKNHHNPLIRKRKLNFHRRFVKNAKKGRFNGGTLIDQDAFDYYCKIMDIHESTRWESEEEKRSFCNNALRESVGREVELSCNQLISRIIQTLLQSASEFTKIEESFSENLKLAFVHRFCSHVTESLIKLSAERVVAGKEDLENSFCMRCIQFSLSNIEEFATGTYTCHIIRTCLDAISTLPTGATSLDHDFYNAIIESPTLPELCKIDLGSALVQSLIRCLSVCNAKLCQKAISKILKRVFASNLTENEEVKPEGKKDLPSHNDSKAIDPVFKSAPSIRLLECMTEYSTGKRFTLIYATFFINRLSMLATHKCSNMAVQKFIRSVRDKREFEAVFDEMLCSVDDLVEIGYSGVILSLAQACLKHGVKQNEFLKALMQTLDCYSSELKQLEIVPKLLAINSVIFDALTIPPTDVRCGLHGSVIVQSLLQFKKPIKVINSLLGMKRDVLTTVFCNPYGCHIADAFYKSPFVGEKSKEKLVHHMKGKFVELAACKYGSRSFDQFWDGSNMKCKLIIIEELHKGEASLIKTNYGKTISWIIGLSTYRKDRDGWTNYMKTKKKKEELFSDIIEEKEEND